MQKIKQTVFAFLSVALLASAAAQAQLVTYQFTGTKTSGTAGIGNTISGEITLDVGASPDFVGNYYSGGQYGFWYDGNFAIDGVTDTGFVAGTSLGGNTTFRNYDLPGYPLEQDDIGNTFYDGIESRYIQLYSYSYTNNGDGITSVPSNWDPNAAHHADIYISYNNYSTGERQYGYFSIDTFTSDTDGDGIPDSEDACVNSDLSPTVVIDGCDSGVENDLFDDGCTISDLISACAAVAENHGDFVSCVAELTNQLKKDGAISGKEKGAIQSCAAKAYLP